MITLYLLGGASIALAVILWSRAWWSAAGVACWILSVCAFNLYNLIPPLPELTGESTASEVYRLQVDYVMTGWQWWSFGLNCVIVMWSTMALILALKLSDFLGKITFGVDCASEWYALVFENLSCNWHDLMGSMLVQVWGTEVARQVCARTLGEWTVYAPGILTVLAFSWIASLAVRRRLSQLERPAEAGDT